MAPSSITVTEKEQLLVMASGLEWQTLQMNTDSAVI